MLGIFSLRIRSLGFFPLLIADHIPPSFSPWWTRLAFMSSRFPCASFLFKCLISFARYTSWARAASSCSKVGVSMVSFLSCSRFFILWAALCFDLSASSLAIVFRSFLNVSHRICGFRVARSVGSCSSSSSFSSSSFPLLMMFFIRCFSSSAGRYSVQRPFPIRGASFGAYFRATSQ